MRSIHSSQAYPLKGLAAMPKDRTKDEIRECVTPEPWEICQHDFQQFFGPVLKCRLCGSSTTYSMDGQPKMILAPAPSE